MRIVGDQGQDETMDFVLYVPKGYGPPAGTVLPNVEETDDPTKILTALFFGSAKSRDKRKR